MDKNKWQLHRAGLLNFWYYDDEEFHFSDGKLLLRGSNGSGKSVTMQSFIPVLLDGKKTPDRLDPFGSRARRMEDYLLGEKDIVDRDERTGYLYLEYKRKNTKQYLTTGIGLRAKRGNSSLDFWGFVILDNRRIGKELLLYKTEYNIEEGKEQKIPLTRKELENRLENGGKVVRGQKEYMELVNKHIFGFESIDSFDELIKLLIQLRSPKLSKDFKPTVIYEILNESLPSLADDELRPLSDTIENMDQTKQQLEQLIRDQGAINRLAKQYEAYNQYVLTEKADGVLKAYKKLSTLNKDKDNLQSQIVSYQNELQLKKNEFQQYKQEEELLKIEEQRLKEHDVFKAEEEKQQVDQLIKQNKGKIEDKESSLNQKKEKENRLKNQIINEDEKQLMVDKEIIELLEELDMLAEESTFFNHALASGEFKQKYKQQYLFDLWKKEAMDYLLRLDTILKKLQEYSKVKEQHTDADKALGEARKELDSKQYEMMKWDKLFAEEKDKLLAEIHTWRSNNTELIIDNEEMQAVAQRIQFLYETYRIEDVKEPVWQSYQNLYSTIQKKIANNQQLIDSKQKEITEKREEYQEWRAKKDIEPVRHQDTAIVREKLVADKIPFVPFFAAVEFRPEVTQELRERIESAITEIGLLDALIIKEQNQKDFLQYNRIIQYKPQLLARTLADYLYPTPVEGIDINKEEIDKILLSILVDDTGEGQTSIGEDGSFQIGLVKGHAPKNANTQYIGKEARRQYRLQEIARLEAEIAVLEEEKLLFEKADQRLKEHLSRLEEEYRSLPNDEDVNSAFNTLNELKTAVKIHEAEVNRKNEKLKELINKLQIIRDQLRELTHDMSLALTVEDYEAARGAMQNYISYLSTLELKHKDWTNSKVILEQYKESHVEVILDIDEIKGELNLLNSELDKLTARLEQISNRLQELGAAEIQAKISQIVSRLGELPNLIIGTSNQMTKIEHLIKDSEKQLSENGQQLLFAEELYKKWQQVFIEDDRLELVEQATPDDLSKEENLLKRAKSLLEQYQTLIIDDSLDRNKMHEKLNNVFYKEQGILVEYRLTQETALELSDLSFFVEMAENENLQMQIEQLRQKSRRIILLMEYEGKRVSPFFVRDQINRDIELQKQILNEKDRELYEEIILNSVGRIIRARINRAEQWVEKINQLMAERDTSSGLTFSIRWKPRTAEVEEELDTKDLVELLRLDPRLLKDDDMLSITRHFKSKIDRAKEVLEEKGYGETLHQLIKEMLDYRKWFSFILYYRKEGEAKKELTNNVFYTFSGGEKAMAMYIPLFSAAYSRYLEANDDAPYIISLDEAFAGVDDNNIRDMFDLVEKLGFNYIMNSQALWGDFDTVSNLSICELVRPKNAPFVTVVRYHWNGKVRQLLHQGDRLVQNQDTTLVNS